MILLTVGTQLPFDRFVRIVDEVAPELAMPITAQIGKGRFRPKNMRWSPFIGPVEFEKMIRECVLIVSHAGIGTVMMAQRHAKPIILFPRLSALEEHRNDHQVATVRALQGRDGIYVAESDAELIALLKRNDLAPSAAIEHEERVRLREAIGGFITDAKSRRESRR